MLKQGILNYVHMYDKMTLRTVYWLVMVKKSVYKERSVTFIDLHVKMLHRLFQTGLFALPNKHGEGT